MTAILTLIYCWLQEFFFSLTDWGLGHLGFPALRGGQHARHHWHGRAHPAGDSRSICVGAGRDGHESGAGHRGERHGHPVHSANHSICPVGLMNQLVMGGPMPGR
jgi:hypothetical protein